MNLRIAFVMPGVGIVERGAEAFVVELCQALNHDPGFEVTLFCRGSLWDPAVLSRPVRALSREEPWVQSLYASNRLVTKTLDTLFLDPLNLEWGTAALSSFPDLWQGGYDVVVMEGGLVGGWLCRFLRLLKRVAFIDIAHGNSPKWEGAFARQRPDRVVAFTQAGADMIRSRAPSARVEVIPHGVDLERFRPDVRAVELMLERPIFLTAGAVDAHKRMDLCVSAVKEAGEGSLLVLGDGPQAESLDEMGQSLLGSRRYLRTKVRRESMPAWYRAADCFTLPSRSESFGLVYLEAMACGLPCVAPDDEVRREVVAQGGMLCEVENAKGYAETLMTALEYPWGRQPRCRAESFPFTTTARAYATLFREVATARRR